MRCLELRLPLFLTISILIHRSGMLRAGGAESGEG